MEDIKLFAKNKKELETLIQAVRIYCSNRIWHRKMCPANNENQKMINDGRNRTTKSRKNQKAWRKGNLLILETKLLSRNLIKRIVSFIRYLRPFLKWMRELQQIDQRTRKLRTIHNALHPRDNVDCMCQEKKEEENLPAFKMMSMHQYD